MFQLILRKELKVFFTSKGNLAIMVLLPLLLISIFGSALGNYMLADYGTFNNGRVFYYTDTQNHILLSKFNSLTTQISDATGVSFVEITDVVEAKAQVEASKAYGVITIQDDGFDYFRSTFNEPEGGEIVRSLFVQLANGNNKTLAPIETKTLSVEPMDSKIYFTFSSLGLAILYMGLLVGFSIHNEKTLDTIQRIYLSKAGIGRMFVAKILVGVLCGMGQILTSFIFSRFIFRVSWGDKSGWIVMLFLLLSLCSAMFGGVIGLICKNKSMCQSIVLMSAILCGFLGGSVTPLFLLENTPVMNILISVSPLHWLNRATLDLRNNLLNESTLYASLVLLGLIATLITIGIIVWKKSISGETKRQEAATS